MGIIKTETFVNEEGIEMRKDTYENGMTIEYTANTSVPSEPEPTQLDRIESMVAKTNEEIANSAVDAYTEELMAAGIL